MVTPLTTCTWVKSDTPAKYVRNNTGKKHRIVCSNSRFTYSLSFAEAKIRKINPLRDKVADKRRVWGEKYLFHVTSGLPDKVIEHIVRIQRLLV